LAVQDILNMNGLAGVFGSLAGSGTVTNSSGTAGTLTFGWTTPSPAAFTGKFARYSDAIPSSLTLSKVGTGTFTIGGNTSDSLGDLIVNQGTVLYSGTGATRFLGNSRQRRRHPDAEQFRDQRKRSSRRRRDRVARNGCHADSRRR